MIRKYTAALILAVSILSFGEASCSRGTRPGPAAPPSPDSAAVPKKKTAPKEATTPNHPPLPQKEPAIRALAMDKFIGERPLDRIAPEDYTLGPLADLSNLQPSAWRESAAGATREFLEGLAAGRLAAAAPGSEDVLTFLLGDLLTDRLRVTRWRMGAGVRRPEGGYSFPVLVEAGPGRTEGKVLVGYTTESGWAVELIALDVEALKIPGVKEHAAFDPTIRTIKSTGR